MSIKVGRYINGIVINPLEFLLDDNGKVKEFQTYEDAENHLVKSGLSLRDLAQLEFIEEDDTEVGRYWKHTKTRIETVIAVYANLKAPAIIKINIKDFREIKQKEHCHFARSFKVDNDEERRYKMSIDDLNVSINVDANKYVEMEKELIDFVIRVAKGDVTYDKEIDVLPEIAKLLLRD